MKVIGTSYLNVTTAKWHDKQLECLIDICINSGVYTTVRVAMLVWVLWNNRNNWVWNQAKEHGQHLGNKAVCMWNEWNEVQNVWNSSRNRG
jgi:hypothetical protein